MLKKDEVSDVREWDKDFNGRFNEKYGISEQFADRGFVVSEVFDVSASGHITTDPTRDLLKAIPSGALVNEVVLDVMTALGSAGGTATLDILLASDDVLETDGVLVNDNAAVTAAGCIVPTTIPKKVVNETNLLLQAVNENFTSGKLRVIVKYYMSRD